MNKYLNVANLLKLLASSVIGLVVFTWWISDNVVMSEDLEAYQSQTIINLTLLKLDLQIADTEDELFKLRLTPERDRDSTYMAWLGRLEEQLGKYVTERNAILTPQK